MLAGAVGVGHEMQIPMLIAYHGSIAVPILVVSFAASYSSLAQLYWQTFLSIMAVLNGLAIFAGALVTYHETAPTFDTNAWVNAAMMAAAGTIHGLARKLDRK